MGDQLGRQRHGLGHGGVEGLGAEFTDVGIGVVLGGQEQEAHAAGVGGVRERGFQRPAGGTAAGGVAVEAEHHRVGEAEQLAHMLVGAGRAQRGHGVGEAPLRQRHHVHVALDHQRIALGAQALAGLVQAVQLLALVEHRCLGGIQVLRLADVQHPATEADDLAAHRPDREHDAVAEAVIALLFPAPIGLTAAGDDQAAVGEQRVGVVGEHAGQGAPALGRIAQAEAGGDLASQAALLQVGHGARGGLERALVVVGGLGQHVAEGGALGAFGVGTGAVFGRGGALGHGQAHLLGQIAHRVHEAHAVVLGQEADGVAVRAAAEAVVGLSRRADDEAG